MKFYYDMRFTFLNDPKDLDLSYKTDLDFLGFFWKEKTPSYNRRNIVCQSYRDKILIIYSTAYRLAYSSANSL